MCCYTNTRPRSGLKNTCSPCKLHRMFVASLYQKTPTLAFPSFGRLGPHSNPCTPYCCSLFFWRREIIFIECMSIFLDSHLFGPNTLWLQTLHDLCTTYQKRLEDLWQLFGVSQVRKQTGIYLLCNKGSGKKIKAGNSISPWTKFLFCSSMFYMQNKGRRKGAKVVNFVAKWLNLCLSTVGRQYFFS